ncbi:hypothetical protein N658DRAFT_488217 [Parathielavia hyrcaniae]|uniref:Uncharacterized protein n=1 Tax=Parathielavia hyrcaniae TaxID=113614 RepID=A0AAN6Q0A7_9PEZI|nr:hypothetical protein N658DRAFT_488217 [Parathielavia hyrcaniae]
MSYSPMRFGCDVPNVLSLARSVAADFSRAPDVFYAGEKAANALISELDRFQRLRSSQTSQASGADESSLAANLMSCRSALINMLEIRKDYPGQRMGLHDNWKWKRAHERRFEREAAALHDATTQLREIIQLLQTPPVSPQPPRRPPPAPAPAQPTQRWQPTQSFRSQVSVQIAQGPIVSQVSLPRSLSGGLTSPAGSQNTGDEGPKPMCPRGSGCREPFCHLRNHHPSAPECEAGRNCCVSGCSKWYPRSPHCPNGPDCPTINSVPGCTKAHPWPRPPVQASNSYWSLSTAQTQPAPAEQSEYSTWGRGSAAASATPSFSTAPNLVSVVSSLTPSQTHTTPRATRDNGNVIWCPARFSCPGGYNGACPNKHPRRSACRDGSACTKGQACTYDHSMHPVPAPASPAQSPPQYTAELSAQSPPRYPAELPGSRR